MGSVQKRATHVLAQGHTGTMSKRPTQYIQGSYPTHLVKGRGCYVWDEDGNQYIDFVCGLGVSTIGYCHPKVVEAVRAKAGISVSMSLPDPLEAEVAEMILELVPAVDKVRFCKTGSLACSAAIRIARAHTKCYDLDSEGYHGESDPFVSLTPPSRGVHPEQFIRAYSGERMHQPYSDILITEPMTLSDSKDRRNQMIKERERREVLIFDEVITGLRVPQGTVSRWWEIEPDIICLGKGLASGYPLAIVAGKKELMDIPDYFVSSTYSGDAVALAACKSTIEEVRKRSLKELYFYANRFQDAFNKLMEPVGVQLKGYGTRATLDTSLRPVQIFMEQAVKSGLFFGKAFFYNFSHMEANVDETVLNICSDISGKMSAGISLQGKPPEDIFKR